MSDGNEYKPVYHAFSGPDEYNANQTAIHFMHTSSFPFQPVAKRHCVKTTPIEASLPCKAGTFFFVFFFLVFSLGGSVVNKSVQKDG